MYQPRPVLFSRFAAGMIDLILIGIILTALSSQFLPRPVLVTSETQCLQNVFRMLENLAKSGTFSSVHIAELQPVLFWPCVVALVWSLLEAFTGATVGKILTGCRVAPRTGLKGNILVWLPRTVLKDLPILLIVTGLLLSDQTWLLAGLAVGIVYLLSCLSLFGPQKQPLYDKISGTSVFIKKHLEA